ncbi:hypothetical protein D3C80_891760 [compost metagenome]
MAIYATFTDDGFPKGFYITELFGEKTRPVYGEAPEPTEENPHPEAPIIGREPNPECKIPQEAVEITTDQWNEFLDNQGARRWVDGKVVEYTPPTPEPEPVVTVLPAVTLWERLTEAEADQVNEVMATQSFRTRKIFETANTFRSDHELWPLLESMATDLFGEARAAELLASV